MEIYTATYSPDDNKLRLYCVHRLDAETYAAAKALGFRWAPKQELFVAPMWTPQREDFLLTLVDEIGDEDTGLVDRAEERAERFEEYSEKRAADAEQAHRVVAGICDQIPLGQPILIGHHSEKRARRAAEKIENGMRRAVKMWDTSKYWERRAAEALAHAKYKELPEVRARRIKTIEADRRKYQRHLEHAEKGLKLWSDPGLTLEKALVIAGVYRLTMARKEGDREDFNQSPDAWSALSNYYPNLYAPRTLAEVVEAAKRAFPKSIARCKRWIAHFDNRLAYEKAMLNEQGGLDLIVKKARPKQLPLLNYRAPEGLQIENRYHRGEFIHYSQIEMTKAEYAKLYTDDKGTQIIDKSHRVRVAITRGLNYSRSWNVVFLTDSKEVSPPKAEVAEPPKAAEVIEPPTEERQLTARRQMDDEVEYARNGKFSPSYLAANREATLEQYFEDYPEAKEDHENEITEHFDKWQRRVETTEPTEPEKSIALGFDSAGDCQSHQEWIGEIKQHREECKAAVNGAKGGVVIAPDFEAMRQQLKAGVQVVVVPSLIETPPELAARMVEEAEIEEGDTVLDPSAGTGKILSAICADGKARGIVAVEINADLAERLRKTFILSTIHNTDFLSFSRGNWPVDRIIMNPPFENGADIKHIKHALTMLKPGGRLVALCANGPRQQAQLEPMAEHWEPLPAGTFARAGTMVNAALLVIEG